MNIITKGDIKKFLNLVKKGLIHGNKKELTMYTSYDNNWNDYYVNVQFTFKVNNDIIEDMLTEDAIDEELKDMLNNLDKE